MGVAPITARQLNGNRHGFYFEHFGDGFWGEMQGVVDFALCLAGYANAVENAVREPRDYFLVEGVDEDVLHARQR
jgi:hypothetical protein